MVEFIKGKARAMMDDGRWDKIKEETITNAKDKINNPPDIAGITNTTESKSFYYNPEFTLNKNLLDANGALLAKAGTYNPLTFKPFTEELIFINGKDPVQTKWAVDRFETNTKKTKIILTAGSYMDLDRKYKIWFFYDQGGTYTQKLHITKVPALVYQEGKRIRVDEVYLPGMN